MTKRIVIIGGGIAGLSAGCYGRMNGYQTEIFKMHTAPGGVCTGWARKGYTFDGCLHWLTGSSADSPFYTIWEELGALKGKRVTNHEAFNTIITSSGAKVVQYADVGRFVEELNRLAPGESHALDQLRDDVRLFGTLKRPPSAPKKKGPLDKLRMLLKIRPYLPLFKRYGKGMAEFIAGFKNPALREALEMIALLPDIPAMSILGLGGKIRYGAKVEEILVKDGRAVGVRLTDGSAHEADEVISAADGRSTVFGMLKGRYVDADLKRIYDTFPLYTPFVQVSFGVRRDMAGEARLITYRFDPPIRFGETRAPFLMLNNYRFDPSMAPIGKTALTVLFWSPFDQWEKIHADRERYGEEKKRIERDVLDWLETIYPGIVNDIEVSDVATPMTTVRYTGNWRASYEGWRPTTATMRAQIKKTLPGLSSFSMIGQWTAPFSGLPTVAMDGRLAIKVLCARDAKPFVTT